MDKLIGRMIVRVSLAQGCVWLDDGTLLYLDEDEVAMFRDTQVLDEEQG